MRIGPIAENLLDFAAVILRLGPRPLLETHGALLLAQALMVATKVGLFEALAESALTPAQAASRCGTDERATARLLRVLEATEYVRALKDGRYTVTADARGWLLEDGPHSLHDSMLFRFVEWNWIARLEEFVLSGRPLDIHAEMTGEQWALYQRGMRSLAGALAREATLRTPVPRRATAMLDIGGSHGFFAVTLCRRHRGLRADILDLPEAVSQAAPILAREGLGDRVVHRVGDARTAELGIETYDLILISNLVHHFDEAESRAVIRRAAGALRPGGFLVIQDFFPPSSTKRRGQIAALLDLYFALTSESGTHTFEQLASWQKDAGLVPRRPIRFLSLPGAGQQNAAKRR